MMDIHFDYSVPSHRKNPSVNKSTNRRICNVVAISNFIVPSPKTLWHVVI